MAREASRETMCCSAWLLETAAEVGSQASTNEEVGWAVKWLFRAADQGSGTEFTETLVLSEEDSLNKSSGAYVKLRLKGGAQIDKQTYQH